MRFLTVHVTNILIFQAENTWNKQKSYLHHVQYIVYTQKLFVDSTDN